MAVRCRFLVPCLWFCFEDGCNYYTVKWQLMMSTSYCVRMSNVWWMGIGCRPSCQPKKVFAPSGIVQAVSIVLSVLILASTTGWWHWNEPRTDQVSLYHVQQACEKKPTWNPMWQLWLVDTCILLQHGYWWVLVFECVWDRVALSNMPNLWTSLCQQ